MACFFIVLFSHLETPFESAINTETTRIFIYSEYNNIFKLRFAICSISGTESRH